MFVVTKVKPESNSTYVNAHMANQTGSDSEMWDKKNKKAKQI